MSLDATAKGTASDSYGTVAEADDYFTNRRVTPSTSWPTVTATKEKALKQACSLMESGFLWKGTIRDYYQRLAWPRTLVLDDNDRYYDYDTVPLPLKEAQFELALALVSSDRIAKQEPAVLGQGLSKITAGPIDLEIDASQVLGLIPEYVITLLERFGTPRAGMRGNSMKQIKLVR